MTQAPVSRYVAKRKLLDVTRRVALRTQLTVKVILSADRLTTHALEARHCVMWLCHFGLGFGWSQIKHATGRDHTTVINGVRRFGFLMTQNEFWRTVAHEVLDEIALGLVDTATHGPTQVVVQPDPDPQPQPKPKPKPVEVQRADVSMYDRDGERGTSRAFLEDQNERFLAALRRAREEETSA